MYSTILRCAVTGNPCGTDTWEVGHPCRCVFCTEWLEHWNSTSGHGSVYFALETIIANDIFSIDVHKELPFSECPWCGHKKHDEWCPRND